MVSIFLRTCSSQKSAFLFLVRRFDWPSFNLCHSVSLSTILCGRRIPLTHAPNCRSSSKLAARERFLQLHRTPLVLFSSLGHGRSFFLPDTFGPTLTFQTLSVLSSPFRHFRSYCYLSAALAHVSFGPTLTFLLITLVQYKKSRYTCSMLVVLSMTLALRPLRSFTTPVKTAGLL
jgi:hypothetical protein